MHRIVTAMLLVVHTLGWAQDASSTRPITIISPYAAGSSTDQMARALADQLQKTLSQTVVVLGREGGSGVIGLTALSQSPPDGLTLAFSPMTPVTVQPHYLKTVKLSPQAVQPLCGVTENILGIAVRSDSPIKSMDDLITAVSTKQLNYGSPGPNSAPFLVVDQLTRALAEKGRKPDLVHAPFKGDVPAIQELLAGRLDFVTIIAASASQFTQDNRLRLVAVASSRRHPSYPNVPTFKESGLPVLEEGFAGLFLPRGVPAPVMARLEAACATAASSEGIRESANRTNQIVVYQPRAVWEKRIQDEFRKQGEAFHRIGGIAQ